MTLKDIFDLKLSDILQLEGFKAKSATNLFNEIARARDVADYQVLAALNVPNVGTNIAKKIMSEYTLDELRKMSDVVFRSKAMIEVVTKLDWLTKDTISKFIYCKMDSKMKLIEQVLQTKWSK